MMRFQGIAGGLLLAVVLLAGCGGGDNERERAGEPVPIFQEFKGQQGPFPDRGFFAVQRPETWLALWGGRQAPNVDFSRQTVLVALMGQQPTAGYDITINEVRASGTRVVAFVSEARPRPSQQTAQVITYPYHMVVVPKATQPIAFSIQGQETMPIAIQDSYVGQQSAAVNPQTIVIRDQDYWRQFWANTFGPTSVPPNIDFAQNMAVAVLLGTRPTAGFNVTITSIEQMDERLFVRYNATSPSPGQPVAQVQTSPYAIAIIPASPMPVAFSPVAVPVVASAQ